MDNRNILKYGLHAVILVGLALAAVKYLNGKEILLALEKFNYPFAPLLLILSAGYIYLKAWRFVVLMKPVSKVPAATTINAYVSGTAATLVPGGVAARAGLMSQAGVPVGKSSVPVAFSSILDQGAFVFGAVAAALWFEPARIPALTLLGIIGVVTLVLLIPQARRGLSAAGDKLARRFKFEQQWQHFQETMDEVFTWRIMLLAFAMTLVGLVFQVLALDMTFRGFGLELPYSTLFLTYVLPAMLGRLSGIPAGAGVTEAGMVGFLASTAQIDPELAAVAAAIFRIAMVFFQALLGAIVYFFFWREQPGRKKDPALEVKNASDPDL